MKLAKLFLPAVAVMAMAMGSIPAQAADKVKIGVAMAVFDDVWLTYVRDAMTKWARLKISWPREWMPSLSFQWIPLRPDR